MREITHWVAGTVFGVTCRWTMSAAARRCSSGSSGAGCWPRRSRSRLCGRCSTRRRSYDSWLPGLRVVVRLVLAASLLEYGMTKVIPTQFPAPPLTALVTPVGEMTLSALLWTTIGSAPAYQIATGCVEVLAGVLLLLPRTVTLGALLALVSLLQVLLLNLTFDIGVKLVTMHLIVLAVILLVPVVRAAGGCCRSRLKAGTPRVRRRSALEAAHQRVTRSPSSCRSSSARICSERRRTSTGASGRSAAADGRSPCSTASGTSSGCRLTAQVRPAELNDYDRRWRRVIFDEPDDRRHPAHRRLVRALRRCRSIASSGTLALTKGNSRTWASRFTFDRASAIDDARRRDGRPSDRGRSAARRSFSVSAAEQQLPLGPAARSVTSSERRSRRERFS